jgi:hypothetical protein
MQDIETMEQNGTLYIFATDDLFCDHICSQNKINT